MNNLFSLKILLTKYNIDGYLVPKNDEYFQETSEPDRLKEITNSLSFLGWKFLFDRSIIDNLECEKIKFLFIFLMLNSSGPR